MGKKYKYLCPHCNKPVSTHKKDVSEGYYGACLNCDEDFYAFELKKAEVKKIKRKET